MKSSIKYWKIAINLLIALAVLLFCIFALPKLLMLFMPFVIGWIIAWIANPPVRFLEKKLKIVRKAGTVVVIVLVIGLVALGGYFIGAKIAEETIEFIGQFPQMWEAIKADVNEAIDTVSVFLTRLPKDFQFEWKDVEKSISDYIATIVTGIGEPTIERASNFAKNVPLAIIGTIFCLLSSYFFIAEREQVIIWVRSFTPKGIQDKWQVVYSSLSQAVGGYFKAQFKIMGIVFIIVVVGLFVCRISYAPIIAFLIALLDFLPFFGTGAVMLPWAVVKVLSGDYWIALGLIITWAVSQLVRQLIQPKIMGDSMGMHPIPSLVLLYLGFKFGGAIGLIIAIPIGMIVYNLFQAGVFDTTVKSIRILIEDINSFRKL